MSFSGASRSISCGQTEKYFRYPSFAEFPQQCSGVPFPIVSVSVLISEMPRRLKLTPLQRDIVWALEEAGSETIPALIATIKPSNEAEFNQNAEGLIKLGLIKREDGNFILTERGRKALTE